MNGIGEFILAPTPHLHFGAGKLAVLPSVVKTFGHRTLLITGARSFEVFGAGVLEKLSDAGVTVGRYAIAGEPSPSMVDEAVSRFADPLPDCVVAIGGGSALDAGKAISAMLPLRQPVKDYLEGVGRRGSHPGLKVPFIACPTTAGTGSEATMNAVLSETGEQGFKRSLRHPRLVPDVAIVDPLLTLSCPPATTAASGMDAFTQLLESWLSTAASPVTDALSLEGLRKISRSLPEAYRDGASTDARTAMALASCLSGITLANAGLGVVHGFASALGGFFQIPHGVICSALMGPANSITVRKLREEGGNSQALRKYAIAGRVFAGDTDRADGYYIDFLINTIYRWTAEMNIPGLSRFGITSADFPRIVKASGNKNNPASLSDDEMMEVLALSL